MHMKHRDKVKHINIMLGVCRKEGYPDEKIKGLGRRMAKEAFARKDPITYDRLAYRQYLKKHLDYVTQDGKVGIHYYARDCDHVSTEKTYVRSAMSVMEWVRDEDHESKWAEGPWFIRAVHPDSVQEERTSTRDHIAEAHENGNPYSVGA